MTATGQLFGSPTYMSHEQLVGAKNVAGRTDIWSLAVILHELLCWEKTGRTASAWARFLEAATMARHAGQSDREKVAGERMARLCGGTMPANKLECVLAFHREALRFWQKQLAQANAD